MHFINLSAQYQAYRKEIDAAIRQVLESALFINGPQVGELEKRLAEYVGTNHAVGFSSGTDSLMAILMAWEIGPGDEVITTPFTFIATAEVISLLGAKPVFVDVEPDTLNLDPNRLEAAITPRTKAIMPVSLFGQMADFQAINAIAERHGLPCLEDGCQSFGATSRGQRSCGVTTAGATSFFPAKPLGCYGDGGMAFTNDANLNQRLRIIREHGQAARYRHAILGINGRLDTLQAAILLAKFPYFEQELAARREAAARYQTLLADLPVRLPSIREGNGSVYSQFTIRLPQRDAVAQTMNGLGVPTAIHYPVPLHRQPVFVELLGHREEEFPIAAQAAKEVLSLPMHPFLGAEEQEQVAAALRQAIAAL